MGIYYFLLKYWGLSLKTDTKLSSLKCEYFNFK